MTDAEMAADIVDRLWPTMVKAITVMDMRGIKTPTTDDFGRTILEVGGTEACGLYSQLVSLIAAQVKEDVEIKYTGPRCVSSRSFGR